MTLPHPFITVRDFALKFNVSERTVRSSLSRKINPLPHVKIGGAIRIDLDAAEKWMQP